MLCYLCLAFHILKMNTAARDHYAQVTGWRDGMCEEVEAESGDRRQYSNVVWEMQEMIIMSVRHSRSHSICIFTGLGKEEEDGC